MFERISSHIASSYAFSQLQVARTNIYWLEETKTSPSVQHSVSIEFAGFSILSCQKVFLHEIVNYQQTRFDENSSSLDLQ
jgi:hypothetical protein